ncbi:MAG: DUF493 domain-containing protein [gamma proteobacterium symbiont of Taylorina sp.]|nr:DUF493 domain-containing protein [gamma proteobacterium symbiont of Taylorina sp.]
MINKVINNKAAADSKSIDEDHLMHFPCDFALKVMGENLNNYSDYVLLVCQKHVEGVTESCVHTRPSRNGKYIAVTVQLVATSRRQLDDLYIELNNYVHTKMAL